MAAHSEILAVQQGNAVLPQLSKICWTQCCNKYCMQNVRSGNYSVVAANHTLILNWNDQTVPLLRQIAINRTERADDTYDG